MIGTPIFYLKLVPLFENLSDAELKVLSVRLGKRVLQPGEVIFKQDDPGDTMYIIRSGRVKIFTNDEQGREIVFNLYDPGNFFGEFSMLDEQPRSASAEALETTQLFSLSRLDFLVAVRQCPEIAIGVMQVLVGRLRYTTEYAESLAFLNIFGRVAMRLLELAERYGRPVEDGTLIDLALPPDDLAGLAGIEPRSIHSVLKSYANGGLIRVDGDRITVLNAEALGRRIDLHRKKLF
ncbi:MAG: Crp/Fnr family transcriptional regulator [Chloroflexi bacterium]|nr:Crp/Fnr family transcriptional regulator [Chloroflexota bacterium]MBU1748562.1 Crp/Fnr family transcriptional regulator [Chloroflexota bacterium]